MQRRLEAATGSRFSFVLSEGRKADLDSAQGGDDGLDIPASGLSTIVLPSSIIQSSSPPHHIPLPRTAATIFATIPLPCAVNGILRPRNVLELFEVEWLASALDQTPVDNLMVLYDVRDLIVDLIVYAAAWFGISKTLSWILIDGRSAAFDDGTLSRAKIRSGKWLH